jgi:uncharacterized membrane protein (DUF2068 family)
MDREPSQRAGRLDLGLRAIVGYKLVKSVAEFLAGTFLLLLPTGETKAVVREVSTAMSEHVAEAWSHSVASLLTRVTTPRHMELIAAALVMDGLLSALEGWALHRRFAWGQWLVIVATSALLPFEIVELMARLSPWRIAAFLANVAVVVYLVRRRTANTDAPGEQD